MFRNRAQHIQWLTESVLDTLGSAASGFAGGVKDVLSTGKYVTGIGASPGEPTLRRDLKSYSSPAPGPEDHLPTLKQYQNSNPPAPVTQPRPPSTTSDSPLE